MLKKIQLFLNNEISQRLIQIFQGNYAGVLCISSLQQQKLHLSDLLQIL